MNVSDNAFVLAPNFQSGLGLAEIDAHSRAMMNSYFFMPRHRGNAATRNIHQVWYGNAQFTIIFWKRSCKYFSEA